MALNNNRDKQRTRVVFVPVTTGGGSQEKIKVGESGLKFRETAFIEIPDVFDFSDLTDFSLMFFRCEKLLTAPQMDTSKANNMYNMFGLCYALQTIPQLNTSQVTNMSFMFQASDIQSIPEMDTSQVTNMAGMFWNCDVLQTIPQLNTSQVTNMDDMFTYCSSLTDLGGFTGLKVNLDLSSSSKITHESLLNVINKAADVTASPATLTLGSTNLSKLTDEEKAIATNKGWTLA